MAEAGRGIGDEAVSCFYVCLYIVKLSKIHKLYAETETVTVPY